MTRIFPFQPYRYSAQAGPVDKLVTQPYDKISPAMQSRYLSLSPHNLVRVILGEKHPSDTESNNVYTRSAAFFNDWISKGILARDTAPALYAYFQRFKDPETGETLERKGFIGLGPVEDYSAGIVHRHEQTLTGPKKDRLEVLKHTHAHFGQLFMLYSDPTLSVDKLLDQAAQAAPEAEVTDEDGTLHRIWKISDPVTIAHIQQLMSDKKLLIADGHHRYETAQTFLKNNPEQADARKVMMTFVNAYSPGLKILATHRVLSNVAGFDPKALPGRVLSSLDELKKIFATPDPDKVRIGIALHGGEIHLFERDRKPGDLDVKVLHEHLLAELLGINEEAVREQKHIEYVRGLDAAYKKVTEGGADVAFLLEPTTIEQTTEVAFGGGVMPQKSTDFYPKMLTGLTIYKLEQ